MMRKVKKYITIRLLGDSLIENGAL